MRELLKAMRLMMRPCREVAEVGSRGMDGEATLGERLGVRLHLMMCAACRRYRTQMAHLRTTLDELRQQLERPDLPELPLPPEMPPDVHDRLRRRLRESM